jgi:hypothetical protein
LAELQKNDSPWLLKVTRTMLDQDQEFERLPWAELRRLPIPITSDRQSGTKRMSIRIGSNSTFRLPARIVSLKMPVTSTPPTVLLTSTRVVKLNIWPVIHEWLAANKPDQLRASAGKWLLGPQDNALVLDWARGRRNEYKWMLRIVLRFLVFQTLRRLSDASCPSKTP